MATVSRLLTSCLFGGLLAALGIDATAADGKVEFFERRVRPVLVQHCLSCHSGDGKEPKGGLRLDLREGWRIGGESGEPAIVPGDPAASLLIQAVQHDPGVSAMPPQGKRLPDSVIADLVQWIREGAVDPRDGTLSRVPREWATLYQERLDWWSLKPLAVMVPPEAKERALVRTPTDRFILAGLESNQLTLRPDADREALVRRLSFALLGLPPDPELVRSFRDDASSDAWSRLVERLLASPYFGEHWARHWMDVVHYADTHGYEWDAPAKNAWLYRDYLVRAFNADVPFQQLILEQIAGDLIEPRVDDRTGLNEALIGPMALRLGERRHGDNSQIEGISQEATANQIDTLGKAFLATTLACAQCHDHKLDAVSQRDYYALAGVLMSTRWNPRTVNATDPNQSTLAEMRDVKSKLRRLLADKWLASEASIATRLREIPGDEKIQGIPETLLALWKRWNAKPWAASEFHRERDRRIAENSKNLRLLADFSRSESEAGWRWEGWGMQHGFAKHGELILAEEGSQIVSRVVPAGRWSNLWSSRLAGAIRSPLFPVESSMTFSVGYVGGKYAAQSMIVDQAFHCERMGFLKRDELGWLTMRSGGFDSLEGSIDKAKRRVYAEIVTKSLNNYFPPRTGYGGVPETEIDDPRSWFGVTRIYAHPPGKPPLDELTRYVPLFELNDDGKALSTDHLSVRFARLLREAIERWATDRCDEEDSRLLNEALQARLLPNDVQDEPAWREWIDRYRALEKQLIPDQVIGTADDWREARNERVGIRGSYTEFGEEVARGGPVFLGDTTRPQQSESSGRLELARRLADPSNPLTARVYVNRVWLHLFGEGLVRTPDDFGHLGERPTHPELLDYLADRFQREGWSLKRLVRELVSSSTWMQSSLADGRAWTIDPENRWWHHMPMRRLEAESLRDSMLVVAGHWDATLGGVPIDPYRTAEDASKRLFRGPVDGRGRRSLYTKVTYMEPPRLLAIFNQPLPKVTVGKRDVTNVPDQALALLNDPFVGEVAAVWGRRMAHASWETNDRRVEHMIEACFGRKPLAGESARILGLAQAVASARRLPPSELDRDPLVWRDVAHALFNSKEFLYVR